MKTFLLILGLSSMVQAVQPHPQDPDFPASLNPIVTVQSDVKRTRAYIVGQRVGEARWDRRISFLKDDQQSLDQELRLEETPKESPEKGQIQ